MPSFFKNHIRNLEKNCKISFKECKDIQFRNRNNQFGMTFISDKSKETHFSRYDDSYMQLYLRGCFIKACLKCSYAQKNRTGDLSIKDCCTPYISMKIKSQKQSSVLINSSKGLDLWNRVKKYLYEYDYSIERIVSEDSMLKHPTRRPRGYILFYFFSSLLGDKISYKLVWGFSSLYRKYFKRYLK